MDEILWAWREWKDGKPPLDGGSWDQPRGLIECFKILEGVAYYIEKERQDKWRT